MPELTAAQKKQIEFFKKFMKDKHLVIADPSPTSRSTIANVMNSLGATGSQMTLAPNYPAAEEAIAKKKPKVVIADYDLEKKCGLDLLQKQRNLDPGSKDCIFMLVTGNSSQSAVARAAEEDVDTFILKPFTFDGLRNQILKAAIMKIAPPEYLKVIDKGKAELQAGKFDDAVKTFTHAQTLDASPSLACYYLGQANQMKKSLTEAKGGFGKGLDYNKIHYKCMVGMYEVLMSEKKHAEAYDVVKRISQYFPANPQRLTSVLRLAIMTQSYEDVERYYRLFTTIDERNPEMVKYICAALVVCGKYYLANSNKMRALELFQKAAVTGGGGNTRILREIVTALVDADAMKQAADFMKRFSPETFSTPDYMAMSLLVDSRVAPMGVVIEKARSIVGKDVHDPLIYHILIRKSSEAGMNDSAEDFAQKASKRWPDQQAAFAKDLVGKSAPAAAPAPAEAPAASAAAETPEPKAASGSGG